MKRKTPIYFNILLVVTILNVVVLLIRNKAQATSDYDFLLWNLFLGFLPLAVAWVLDYLGSGLNKYIFYFMSFVWLIFYPNAPYMMSDVIHVEGNDLTIIYNGLIIFSLATLSLFYGFLSIKIMYRLFEEREGKKLANLSLAFALLFSCLGFYMGRILRLNSWDIFTRPWEVVKETFNGLWPISEHPETYIIMFLFGGIQYMLLIMMKDINSVKN